MTAFFDMVNGEILQRCLYESWIEPYGPPRVIRLDASKAICGQAFLDYLDG